MLPIGHLAFAYLFAWPVIRDHRSFFSLVTLFAGATSITIANEFMKATHIFGLTNRWSHTPLIILVCIFASGLVYLLRLPYRWVLLLFALGAISHLVGDFVTDFALLYFSDQTNDIGGWWLFPFDRVTVKQPRLEPGFSIRNWQLLVETIWLAVTLWLWYRDYKGIKEKFPWQIRLPKPN